MADIYLGDVVFALGEHKRSLEETEAAGQLLSAAADLAEVGFRWHHVCGPSTSAYDLAHATVGQLARDDRIRDVDAIIYATCLPESSNVGDPDDWERSRDVK